MVYETLDAEVAAPRQHRVSCAAHLVRNGSGAAEHPYAQYRLFRFALTNATAIAYGDKFLLSGIPDVTSRARPS
jgi:hypothetical protein